MPDNYRASGLGRHGKRQGRCGGRNRRWITLHPHSGSRERKESSPGSPGICNLSKSRVLGFHQGVKHKHGVAVPPDFDIIFGTPSLRLSTVTTPCLATPIAPSRYNTGSIPASKCYWEHKSSTVSSWGTALLQILSKCSFRRTFAKMPSAMVDAH